MLPVERRVRRRDDFSATVRDGRRAATSGLVVHVRTDADGSPARAGFIVGRSVGTAVVRNRVRRQLRHLIAPRLISLPAGAKVVVRVLPAAASLSRGELAAALSSGLERALRAATSARAVSA